MRWLEWAGRRLDSQEGFEADPEPEPPEEGEPVVAEAGEVEDDEYVFGEEVEAVGIEADDEVQELELEVPEAPPDPQQLAQAVELEDADPANQEGTDAPEKTPMISRRGLFKKLKHCLLSWEHTSLNRRVFQMNNWRNGATFWRRKLPTWRKRRYT
jgi:hypothetical protein